MFRQIVCVLKTAQSSLMYRVTELQFLHTLSCAFNTILEVVKSWLAQGSDSPFIPGQIYSTWTGSYTSFFETAVNASYWGPFLILFFVFFFFYQNFWCLIMASFYLPLRSYEMLWLIMCGLSMTSTGQHCQIGKLIYIAWKTHLFAALKASEVNNIIIEDHGL